MQLHVCKYLSVGSPVTIYKITLPGTEIGRNNKPFWYLNKETGKQAFISRFDYQHDSLIIASKNCIVHKSGSCKRLYEPPSTQQYLSNAHVSTSRHVLKSHVTSTVPPSTVTSAAAPETLHVSHYTHLHR